MVKKEIVVRSHPASAHHLISALEACARHDIYWSNEFFYRWLTEAPQPRAWKFQWRSLVARHPNNVSLDVEGRRFVVKMRQGAAGQRAFLEQVAGDPHLPGAAVAWARWLAQAGRETEALKVVKDAYAGIEGSRLPWDFHILRNQITALEWRIADKKVPRGLQRYLGDDDGHMLARTCPYPFERIDLQENGTAGVCCAQWMPGFSVGNVITGDEKVSQIYNGEKALSARRSVIDGSFRYCDHEKCPLIFNDTLPTKDEVAGDNAKHAIATGELVFESPSYVLLAFDQSCNLSCPGCRLHVITEKIDLQITKESLIEESVIPMLKVAKTLFLNGAGELFVSRPLRRLLSKLNEKEFPNLRIDIITNGTLFTPKEWDKFPGIHDMVRSVRVSTDGATKKTFERLRRGATWEPFLDNMHFLASLRKSGIIQTLQFSLTYQRDNFLEMPLFLDLTRDIDPERQIIFEKLENWGTFDPDVYRDLAVHKLGHPLHADFLSIIRRPELDPGIPNLLVDYGGFV